MYCIYSSNYISSSNESRQKQSLVRGYELLGCILPTKVSENVVAVGKPSKGDDSRGLIGRRWRKQGHRRLD